MSRANSTRRTVAKADEQKPSVIELAMLAATLKCGPMTALSAWFEAQSYLETDALDDISLFRKLRDGGREHIAEFAKKVDSKEATPADYKALLDDLFGGRYCIRLYMDKREDQVKDAIKNLTGRRCGYETARDYIRDAWLRLKCLSLDDAWRDRNATLKEWDEWLQGQHRGKKQGDEDNRYVLIPRNLLHATEKLINRKLRPEQDDDEELT